MPESAQAEFKAIKALIDLAMKVPPEAQPHLHELWAGMILENAVAIITLQEQVKNLVEALKKHGGK